MSGAPRAPNATGAVLAISESPDAVRGVKPKPIRMAPVTATGVPNPQAPDKAIPPLSGQDFRKEFNTDAKILEFIRSGSVIGKAPITSMPHWGGIIPDWQLKALVAYLKTLK